MSVNCSDEQVARWWLRRRIQDQGPTALRSPGQSTEARRVCRAGRELGVIRVETPKPAPTGRLDQLFAQDFSRYDQVVLVVAFGEGRIDGGKLLAPVGGASHLPT